jgi:dTDP-glucose 4,6-dehydratase
LKVLLTGAGGFIGHHLLEHLLTETGWDVACTDSFRHKGKTDRIAQVLAGHPDWAGRVDVITHDLTAPFSPQMLHRIGGVGHVIAMASESHVDRSITDPVPFVQNNTAVILNTLQAARECLLPDPGAKVLLVSTDEVYGPVQAGAGGHAEWAPVIPSNPYAASKAAQEAIAVSYWRAYGLPVVITNMMNTIGERQDAEKFTPKAIRCAAYGETLTIHGQPGNIGTRHYLHARNSSDAWLHILRNLPAARFPDADRPDRYNVAGPAPVSNLDLALQIARIVGKPLTYELVDFHSARPGHDPHYGLDPGKLAAAGWKPPVDFGESLERTVRWTLAHPEWM